jgi:hypothetical protein
MKYSVKIILVLLYLLIFFGQENTYGQNCKRKRWTQSDQLSIEEMDFYSNDLDTFVQKYVKKYCKENIQFINKDTGGLIPIRCFIRLENSVSFFLKKSATTPEINVDISIKKSELNFRLDNVEIFEYEKSVSLIKIRGEAFWGATSISAHDTSLKIKEVEKIMVIIDKDTVCLPKNLFNDLINPNYLYKVLNFNPIEVYYEPKKKSVYIYICGDVNCDSWDCKEESPYLCKLIFKQNGESSRIIISGRYLSEFEWMRCFNFWVF